MWQLIADESHSWGLKGLSTAVWCACTGQLNGHTPWSLSAQMWEALR